MKKSLTVLIAIALSAMTTYSQTIKEEVDYYQSIYGMGKKALVSNFIEVEGTAADALWTFYDEYETARKELGQTRIELLAYYADSYLELNDEKTDEIIKAIVSQKKSMDKLIVKYYKKMKKAAGTKPAAQFYQLENYFLASIRMEILDNIPFIGELD
jgi:hypothetical protein